MPGFWEYGPTVASYVLHVDVVATAWALGIRNLQPHNMPIIPIAGQPYDMARNSGTLACLNAGADFVFAFDSDVVMPSDTVLRLMRHNLPIVSGVYYRRSPPHGLPVMIKNGWWYHNAPENSLVEVDVVGAGCLLIRRDVLETLPWISPERGKRWFDWRVDMAHLLPPGEAMSEDFSFCLHARKNGLRIIVDTSIQCEHLGLAKAKRYSLEPLVAGA